MKALRHLIIVNTIESFKSKFYLALKGLKIQNYLIFLECEI